MVDRAKANIPQNGWDGLIVAEQEGLLRFPDAPQALVWKKEIVYSMIQAGWGGQVGPFLANLLSESPKELLADLANLNVWIQNPPAILSDFTQKYYRSYLETTITSLNVHGYTDSHLIHINHYEAGGICLLTLDAGSKLQTWILYEDVASYEWLGPERRYVDCYAGDITNDGILDVIVSHWEGGHIGYSLVQVYDISHFPPELLPFDPAGTESLALSEGDYRGIVGREGIRYLNASEGDNLSDMEVSRLYRWNGEWLELTDLTLTNVSPICYYRLHYLSQMEPAKAAAFLDNLLLKWKNSEYPELRDMARMHSGILHSLSGDAETTINRISDIISAPSVPTSTWIVPAQKFLENYHSPTDLYTACTTMRPYAPTDWEYWGIDFCSPQLALKYLIETSPSMAYPTIIDRLKSFGVPIRADGVFDFESDYDEEFGLPYNNPIKKNMNSGLWGNIKAV